MEPMLKLWILLALVIGEILGFFVISRRAVANSRTLAIVGLAQFLSLVIVGVVLFLFVK